MTILKALGLALLVLVVIAVMIATSYQTQGCTARGGVLVRGASGLDLICAAKAPGGSR